MTTSKEIAKKYLKLKENRLQKISWAIPFKDPKANAEMEKAEKEFEDYANLEWQCVVQKESKEKTL